VWEDDKKSDESVVSHILSVREQMEEMRELVKENIKTAQRRQKKWGDQTGREREVRGGTCVVTYEQQ